MVTFLTRRGTQIKIGYEKELFDNKLYDINEPYKVGIAYNDVLGFALSQEAEVMSVIFLVSFIC